MQHRRVPLALLGAGLVAAAALATAACGGGANEATAPASPSTSVGTAGVSIGTPAQVVSATGQLQFAPTSITVTTGQVIQWKNTGSVLHTVTFDQSGLSDPALQPGATWEVQFTQPGTYEYRCTIHAGMQGTIVVTKGS